MFTLDPQQPATDQIVSQMLAAIDSGRLGDGARLPSVRQLAAQLEVSVFTVVNAYDRLLARGCIRSRVGAGYFVCRRPGMGAPALVAAETPTLPNTPLGLVQGVLGGNPFSDCRFSGAQLQVEREFVSHAYSCKSRLQHLANRDPQTLHS